MQMTKNDVRTVFLEYLKNKLDIGIFENVSLDDMVNDLDIPFLTPDALDFHGFSWDEVFCVLGWWAKAIQRLSEGGPENRIEHPTYRHPKFQYGPRPTTRALSDMLTALTPALISACRITEDHDRLMIGEFFRRYRIATVTFGICPNQYFRSRNCSAIRRDA